MIKNYTDFVKLTKVEIQNLTNEYENLVNKARDKRTAHYDYHRKLDEEETLLTIESKKYDRFFIEIEAIYNSDNTIDYDEIFNKKIKSLAKELTPNIEKRLISLYSKNEFYKHWREIDESYKLEEMKKENRYELKWAKENETEFVQFVYSLFEGGYIKGNDEKIGITKIVEIFAKQFNFKIGKNWHINHSSSIHKRNRDYVPPIFDDLKKSYQTFQDKRIDKKKKLS